MEVAVRVEWIGIRTELLHIRETIAVVIARAGEYGEIGGELEFPHVRNAVAVQIRPAINRVGLNEGEFIVQTDPTAVRAPDEPAQTAAQQVHLRSVVGNAARGAIGEHQPTGVGAVGEAGKISDAVMVYAKVGAGIVLIPDAIVRRAIAEIDPTHVGGVDSARANESTNDGAIGRVAAPVYPPDVGAIGETIDRIDCRGTAGGPRQAGPQQQNESISVHTSEQGKLRLLASSSEPLTHRGPVCQNEKFAHGLVDVMGFDTPRIGPTELPATMS